MSDDEGSTARQSPGRWSDLKPRLISGGIIALVGITAVWLGGILFAIFASVVAGVIVWELARMHGTSVSLMLGGLAGVCCLLVSIIPEGYGLPLLMLPAFASIGRMHRARLSFAIFTAIIVLAGYGLVQLREDFGALWMVWLVMVVIATDIFGYFGGRLIGGPKFWPRVSPKKTWAGILCGWVSAGLVGLIFLPFLYVGPEIVSISVALSMASQLGDVTESAIKRKAGVKDSSHLIPGHGGFFDRFDGVLGAAVFLLLVEQIVDFPPIAV
ncbi:phosphatidate cytidylyltransferase [Qingshengfaniella alkalisoli]|uniref:Phosphatidate cytidylyltransferase n=1 Tax=Qingshengfaniella alkalisoli TaxID=2599296 RepID=A0A5B8IUK2_9RHOB|nr:phosphatidate cytidylyltransferase [Qingshengfaniella alkalisoli]QDY69334.1 phosphatidate cytidylyltransferase [Qingshengfaniella alkalisoli]